MSWISKGFRCISCKSHPIVDDSGQVGSDYKWICPNNNCQHSLNYTYTYDTDEPLWLYITEHPDE